MNYWAIGFPGLMYLASVGTSRVLPKLMVTLSANVSDTATGIMLVYYQTSQPDCRDWSSGTTDIGIPYFSISVSLNILLTLMIVARLILHSRNVRDAMRPLVRPSGLYNAVVSMLIESSALYAVNFILFIGAWATSSPVQFIFFPVLAQTQVRAVFTFPQVPSDRSRK